MARSNVSLYCDGDRLEDGLGNVGYVRACKSKAGDRYLKVLVTDGPRQGEWVYPERFARPSLDWDPEGPSTVCADCHRVFHGGTDPSGLRRIFCRPCDGQHAAREKRMAADASPSHDFGSRRPRVYRRDATDDVEDLIADDVRNR